MEKKPGLMIAVMDSLKKKGKMEKSPEEGDDSDSAYREHLEEISKELIDAVGSKDHQAVADLLEEAFLCIDSQPHEEGPSLGEDESEDKSNRY